ncbi:hypothetical protein T4D_9767 [Trichinella pseudospiralis]|uniref:Uncharacterized protein n=1 Tax=Trichinella pseudospiralis TaxID=6337 RepID=A0A0V1FMZ4_TRIPS|nr:hypothetical protein T4D_9767 [Trichinella pseudospiralis]
MMINYADGILWKPLGAIQTLKRFIIYKAAIIAGAFANEERLRYCSGVIDWKLQKPYVSFIPHHQGPCYQRLFKILPTTHKFIFNFSNLKIKLLHLK